MSAEHHSSNSLFSLSPMYTASTAPNRISEKRQRQSSPPETPSPYRYTHNIRKNSSRRLPQGLHNNFWPPEKNNRTRPAAPPDSREKYRAYSRSAPPSPRGTAKPEPKGKALLCPRSPENRSQAAPLQADSPNTRASTKMPEAPTAQTKYSYVFCSTFSCCAPLPFHGRP